MKNIIKKVFFGLFSTLLVTTGLNGWDIPQVPSWNKVDIAPAYVHMDILENGNTVHRLDMTAARLDSSFIFCGGWTIKPMFMIARGDKGHFDTVGAGFGYTLPLSESIVITPLVGLSYSYLSTRYDLHLPIGSFFTKRTYRTYSPYVGLDAVYSFGGGWRIGGSLQYAWANSRTSVGNFAHNEKSEAQGFVSALTIEKDITENLSVNIGAGYNNSMTKEKHGLRGYGAKVGIAYWF
ncbi:MAG: hypothetical protein WC222_01190 [Parachlamydiales bacterium]|jgi:hypothetical protein